MQSSAINSQAATATAIDLSGATDYLDLPRWAKWSASFSVRVASSLPFSIYSRSYCESSWLLHAGLSSADR